MMRRWLLFLLLALLVFPQSVLADGVIISPPNYQVYETSQKAVIWFENNQETLILSTVFKGDAADFGWIIPVPSRPEVEKSSDELFTSLKELTEPEYKIQDFRLEGDFGVMQAPAGEKVTVVETKKVDIYEVSVVTSTETQALAEWFEKNDYPYPVSQAYILDEYIQNHWFFVCAKIDTEKLGSAVQGQLKGGHATPLSLKFQTQKIVYPLKISSITGDFYKSDVVYKEGFNLYGSGGWTTDGVNSSITHDLIEAFEGIGSIKLQAEKNNLEKIEATRVLGNLIKGKTYTYSVYLKTGKQSSGSAYLYVGQGELENRSSPITLTDQWQRLTLTFTAQTKSPRLKIIGLDFQKGESFSLDAVQVELGNTPTRFESTNTASEKRALPLPNDIEPPGIKLFPMPPLPSQERIEVLLYIFDPKKKVEIPGFQTSYAGWVRSKEIEKLAVDDQGNPLFPAKRKMYLTKLNRSLTQSEMTSDLYPRYADKNQAVGRGSSIAVEPRVVVLIFGLPLLVEVGFLAWLYSRRKDRKEQK